MEKVKYIVINASSLSKLESIVNDMILHGYIPQGGISVYFDRRAEYFQAMIFEESKEKDIGQHSHLKQEDEELPPQQAMAGTPQRRSNRIKQFLSTNN